MIGLPSLYRGSIPSSWILPFLGGAASASLLWTVIYLKYELYLLGTEIHYDSDDSSAPEQTKRGIIRWPWDKLRTTVINASTAFLNMSDPNKLDSTNVDDKTGPCIGAIFGLDVGGTLTKLVYFEEQIHEYKRIESSLGHHRKEHYNAAASAFQVLSARTNTMGRRHDDDSETDLHMLMDQRIESVPDRLDQFTTSCNNISRDKEDGQISPERARSPGSVDLEQHELSLKRQASSSDGNLTHQINCNANQDQSTKGGMKKSISLADMTTSNEHAEVLNNFYSFARRLDTYQTAVKEKELSYYSRSLNGQFHFIRFETRHMQNAMNLMRINDFHRNIKEIGATGGGAHKYAQEWDKGLGITMKKQDEMDSLVAGMQFVMSDIVGECYTFKPNDWKPEFQKVEHDTSAVNGSLKKTPNQSNNTYDNEANNDHINSVPSISEETKPKIDEWWTSKKVQRDNVMGHAYPYLLVSIGTGVSILRVDGPRQHERVSGSTIGGGTYWGLCRLLTGSDSFSDVLDLAMKGDPSKVDMMVGDIYGKNSDALEKIGLPSDIVASSFGKLVAKNNPSEDVKGEDLARALLLMVTNNIGQVAHLNARLHHTARIYFVGTFLQHNTISQQRLAHAIDYWSKGEMEAQFLEHEGYFGALGAFLLNHGIGEDVSTRQPRRSTIKALPSQQRKRSLAKLHHRSKSMNHMHHEV